MDDFHTATTFKRHNRPLRGVLIDDQPWFVAHDLACLLGLRHPHSLAGKVMGNEVRGICLLHASGNVERVEVINEPALYKALVRYGHPEYRAVAHWLADEVIPLLRDQGRIDPRCPRRLQMSWRSQRVTVLDWQGRIWVPLEQLPTFSPIASGVGGWLGRLRGEARGD
ncbi:BRO family protein [Pseudomonas sp. ZM24]|uniref:BRO-N domain-containing protein n=1 Tax=Pseudomonas triclosanedens TaxID=2961893 RepID=UPI0020C3EA34|nr:BRO family protein [Pseudomonas triclosanedens]MCP8478417.1 BRO family protein [Pseudomonas triclosanedens]